MNNYELDFIKDLEKKMVGCAVDDVQLGYSAKLHISNGKFFVKVDVGYCVANYNGKDIKIDPEDMDSKKNLLSFYKSVISSFSINQRGDLEIQFNGGSQKISNPSADKFEAWELNSLDGIKVVCMPGGKLAIWDNLK